MGSNQTDLVQPEGLPQFPKRVDSWFGDDKSGLNCASGNPFDTYTPVIDYFLTRHLSI